MTKDIAGLSKSTPIVVYAHIPLWAVYPSWGWGTDDAEQALALLKGFGSVTVLNGHIHQVLSKIEGNVTFHTAYSTAFPQPAPGTAAGPGPLTVPAAKLRGDLTGRTVDRGEHRRVLVFRPAALLRGVGPLGRASSLRRPEPLQLRGIRRPGRLPGAVGVPAPVTAAGADEIGAGGGGRPLRGSAQGWRARLVES